MPLWWDAGTLAEPLAWKRYREHQGAVSNVPFLVALQASQRGQPLSRHAIRSQFITA